MKLNGKLASALIVLPLLLQGSQALAQSSPDPDTPAKKTTPKKHSDKTSEKKHTEKSDGAVHDANKAADDAADKANRAVVGNETQDENETRARDPKERRDQNPPKEENPAKKDEPSDTAKKVGKTTTTAVDVVDTGVRDVTRATDKPGKYNPFAIEYNPLGLIVGGRVSIQAEWAPATHHAIVVSPHFVHTTADVAVTGEQTASQSFTGFGGELGYRYYTGHKGMNGVFIGPSLIAGAFNASLPNNDDQAFTNVGVAADVGLQQVFWEHLVLGGGVGIEYLSVSHDFHDLPSGPSTIASTGIKPRLLLSGGYAF